MAKNIYTVKPGESPADVAQKYTGRRDRYRDLLALNSHLRQTTDGMTGRAVFDKKDWIPGMGIRIPKYWADKGPMYPVHFRRTNLGSPGLIGAYEEDGFEWQGPPQAAPGDKTSQSSSGEKCTPGGATITEFKDYYYVVTQGDVTQFSLIPVTKFGMPEKNDNGWTWQELRNANLPWYGGTRYVGVNCMLYGLKAGDLLRVPKYWPEPKPGVKTVPITEAKDKCPAGQVFAGGKCVDQGGPEDPWKKEGGLETVGAESGDSNVIWMLLAAGAAVAGGIFLYNSKKKTTR